MTYHIRPERSADFEAIKVLIKAAVATEVYSDQQEHHLVGRLRKSDAYFPDLALVAEEAERIVGHILLTRIFIVEGAHRVPALALAPVSVHPDWQSRGIGGALIRAAHDTARQKGEGIVVLLGHADYYPRFGYEQADRYRIKLPFPVPPENCMVMALYPGHLRGFTEWLNIPKPFGNKHACSFLRISGWVFGLKIVYMKMQSGISLTYIHAYDVALTFFDHSCVELGTSQPDDLP